MKNIANIITIKNLHKKHVQNGVFSLHVDNFHVQKGELVALVGPSGCGKSTALDLLSTALEPDVDQSTPDASEFSFTPQLMRLNVLELWKNKAQATLASLRQKHIGYVLQTGGLLPFLSGYDNILLSCQSAEHVDGIAELASVLDIAHLLQKKPAQMSVGERQRFAIARALIHKPQLILADEPVASLDPYNAHMVLELFVAKARENNISVVMVSHAPAMAHAAGFRLVQAKISRKSREKEAQADTHHEEHIHAYIDTHNSVDVLADNKLSLKQAVFEAMQDEGKN